VLSDLLLVLELGVPHFLPTRLLILDLLLLFYRVQTNPRNLYWELLQCTVIVLPSSILLEDLIDELFDWDPFDAALLLSFGARVGFIITNKRLYRLCIRHFYALRLLQQLNMLAQLTAHHRVQRDGAPVVHLALEFTDAKECWGNFFALLSFVNLSEFDVKIVIELIKAVLVVFSWPTG